MADLVKMLERLLLLRDFLGFFPLVDAVSSSRSISVEVRSPWSGVPGRAGLMSAVEARRMTPPMREVHFFVGVWLAMAGKSENYGGDVVGVEKEMCCAAYFLSNAVPGRCVEAGGIILGHHVFCVQWSA